MGDVGSLNDSQAEPFGVTGWPWGSKYPRVRSKRPNGIERQRAPNVTHSEVFDGRAPPDNCVS